MIQNKDFIIGMDLTQLLELVNKSLKAFTANGWSESGREARSAAGEEKEAHRDKTETRENKLEATSRTLVLGKSIGSLS